MTRLKGLLLGVLVCLGAEPLWSQDRGGVPAALATQVGSLTVAGLEERLEAIEADASLSDEVRTALKGQFAAAIEQLSRRDADQAQLKAYQDSVETSAASLEKVAEQVEDLKLPVDRGSLVSAAERDMESADFGALVVQEEAELSLLRSDVSTLEATLSNEKLRPVEIQAEVSTAQDIVREAGNELSQLSDVTPGTAAEGKKVLAQARKVAGEVAIAKLEQEQMSSGERLKLLQAELELARAKVKFASARVQELEGIQASRLDQQVAEANKEAEAAQEVGGLGSAMQIHATTVVELSAALKKVADRIREVDADEDQAEQRLAELKSEKLLVDRQIEIGGGRGAFVQILLEQQRKLPQASDYHRELVRRQEEITEVRFSAFEVEEKLREQSGLVEEAGKVGEATRDKVLKLLETRERLLKQLDGEYQRLTRKLGQLDLVERQTAVHVEEFGAVLEEALFWVPSSPKVGLKTFQGLPEAVQWLVRPGRLGELWNGIARLVMRSPLQVLLPLAFLVGVMMLRSRFRRVIASHRIEIRKISTDRYVFTLQGFGMVLLMVAPLPLFLWSLGQGLLVGVDASDWLRATGMWLKKLLPLVFILSFVRELCRDDGLADVHFGWDADHRGRVRRDLILIAMVYLPMMWVIMSVVEEDSGRFVHDLGRMAYVGTMLWMSFLLSHLIRPKDGVFSKRLADDPEGALSRLRYLWYLGIVGMPVVLSALACMGYLFTAFELTVRFARTLGIIGASYMLYWLMLRWFVIRERRVALAQLHKARQAKRESAGALAQERGENPVAAEEGSIPGAEAEAVDLVQVGEQTRHLLRLLVGCLAVVGIWFVWAEALPVLRYLDTEPFLWSATVADLLLGGLILVATVVLAKNLPGVLEISVLSNLVVDAGSRYAVAALVQYGIVAVGLVAMFEAVGMDWSQFGWMAAALGVGLGFGLQEIVANFVSGIILLFERPIRVGDVVTIGETSGVVSRIRIRATTITDWDRKEYVVPNKEFITGRLLNWTLSNKVNRIVIKVGVAYGSDTAKVRDLLLRIVGEHPDIMDDPGPGVTFENFGDSSLDFTVRCYLPDLDRRLATIHELHAAIHERFGAEGIEIPFPQRDLNIRSGWGGEA